MMNTTQFPHRRFGLLVLIAAFLADQISKYLVVYPLSLEAKMEVRITSFFNLTWAENCGISMNMLGECSNVMRWSLVGITGAVAIAVLVWMTRERAKADVLALAMIAGGALGNIVDRVRYGYVVDFADLHFGEFRPFLIFNVADACITLGVLLLVARALLLREKDVQADVSADVANRGEQESNIS